MKLIVQDNDGQQHVVIEKVEFEFSTVYVGQKVLEFVNRIEIEGPRCGTVGRGSRG